LRQLRSPDGLHDRARHPNGGGLGAAKCEGRTSDTHHQWIAGRPHSGDDLAARAGHESEIAQPCQQGGATSLTIVDSSDIGETGDEA
jgi:hypothetical protein